MILAFDLDMPQCGSWNGKWTSEGQTHCIIKTFHGKQSLVCAREMLDTKSWTYDWGDGWMARITVSQVDAKEAARLKKKSCGFAGYDWMVDTIIKYNKPLASHAAEKLELEQTQGAAMSVLGLGLLAFLAMC